MTSHVIQIGNPHKPYAGPSVTFMISKLDENLYMRSKYKYFIRNHVYCHSCIWKRRIFAIWRIWRLKFTWAITFFDIHTVCVGSLPWEWGSGLCPSGNDTFLTVVMITCVIVFCICFSGVESEDFFDGYESAVYVAAAKELTSRLSFTFLLLLPKNSD